MLISSNAATAIVPAGAAEARAFKLDCKK